MDQDLYIGLIHQDLQGALPDEGHRQLAEWRLADPEHPILEEQVRKSWELSQQYEPELKLDTDAAFNVLRTRVRAHEKQNTATVRSISIPRSNRRSWLGIAAALLLLLSAGWFFLPPLQVDGPMATIETKLGDSPREVTLPDGTKVWLRENSRLEHPETFTGKTRKVTLTGEAFFDVTKNPEAPFKINLPGAEVEVLGTSFLVSARADTTIEVSVQTGKVALKGSRKTLLLFKGKAGSLDPATQEIAELNYLPNAAAWRNNTLVFDDQPLPSVVNELEAYFKVSIIFANRQLLDCRFGGRFPNADLTEILDAMQPSHGITWKKFDDEYQLDDGNCQ
jgi:ferric-dicitrate binding protein FerR (iron transport regulator)